MIKVSVIVPNYNHGKFLDLRIDSILNQTFEDFELIILDDCSTDDSREIIESYRNHPKVVAIIYNEQNSGSTFLQWEKGIQLASAKFIWLAESDDFSDRNFLKQIILGMESNPGVGVAFCASNITDQDNNVSSKNYNYGKQINKLMSNNFVMNGQEFCEQYLFFGCLLVNASAVVFEKKLYGNIAKDFKTYKVSGDWRMWVEICYNSNVLYINESLNYFRFHTNNVRTNKANIMNGEAILNYIASFKKTGSKSVKQNLKSRLFKHWCFEFSRDLKTFQFSKSMKFMYEILKVDHYFFFRLVNHSFIKTFHLAKKSK